MAGFRELARAHSQLAEGHKQLGQFVSHFYQAQQQNEEKLKAFFARGFFGRLRWLLTGK